MNELKIGQIIRKFRKEKNLTIKDLAEQVNITSSMLSQIERDLANPSLNTVRGISQALDIPIFKFFMEHEDPKSEDFIVRSDNRMQIILDGTNYQLLTPTLNTTIEFMLLTLEPGSKTVTNPTSHNGEEVAYVIEGQIELNLEGSSHLLDTGDSVKIPPNIRHNWVNNGDSVTTIIFAVTPPDF